MRRHSPELMWPLLLGLLCFTRLVTADEPLSAVQPLPPPLLHAPKWLAEHEFTQEQFTFVRVRYSSLTDRGNVGRWMTDWPDADLNLSEQIRQSTTLPVEIPGKVLRLTDESLEKYPFLYVAEAGHMQLTDLEVVALRRYLSNGGFLMVDDFWGDAEWRQFAQQIKRVFPDKTFFDLPLEHRIFHCVFDFDEKPQVVSIHHALSGLRTERKDAAANYRGLADDQERLMIVACHNNDLADGWERSGVDRFYTEEFSVKRAYPMGINIVFFALTQE